jgi:hypothetical protein
MDAMSPLPARILGCLLALAPFAGADPVTTWTTTSGRKFEAAFVKIMGSDAIFSHENGRTFTTPLVDLDPNDRNKIQAIAIYTQPRQQQAAPPERSNFGASWPTGVRIGNDAASKVASEDKTTGIYVYESGHYRFLCDARLTSDVLRNFATLFEATFQYSMALPLSMSPPRLKDGKMTILLFETKENYHRLGGPPGTSGCMLANGYVLVPMSSLGLTRVGTGFSLDTNYRNSVLIHELAHQLTPLTYFESGSRGWFTEGLAEYFAVTPYSWGYYQPDPHGNYVLKHVTAYGEDGKGGRALGTKISAPKLRSFFLMEYRDFSGSAGNLNYGLGLLLTHYFFHMEGNGKGARISEFLKGLKEGKSGEEALAPLLNGGSYEKLESEISDAWRKKGVEIVFGG